jgi:hypothetical protein
MNNKKFLIEINRINELMGNKLLTETKVLTNILDKLIDDLIAVSGRVTTNRELTKQLTKIKNSKSYYQLLDVLPTLKNIPSAKVLISKLEDIMINGITDSSKANYKYIEKKVKEGTRSDFIIKVVIGNLEKRFPGIVDDDLKKRLEKEIRERISELNSSKKIKKTTKLKNVLSIFGLWKKNVNELKNKLETEIDKYTNLTKVIQKNNELGSDLNDQILKQDELQKYVKNIKYYVALLNSWDIKVLNNFKRVVETNPEYKKLVTDENINFDDIINIIGSVGPSKFKIEPTFWQEVLKLRNERWDTIKRAFPIIQRLPMVKKLEKTPFEITQWTKDFVNFTTGNLIPLFKKLASNPAQTKKILSTELVSRLISYPLYLALFETLYGVYVNFTYKKGDNKPTMLYSIPGAKDYNEIKDVHAFYSILLNFVKNWLENLNYTIPSMVIKDIISWLGENLKKGKFWELLNYSQSTIESIKNDDSLSQEEKEKKLMDLVYESKSWVDEFINSIGLEFEETIGDEFRREFIEKNIKPAAPCLFEDGWSVSVEKEGGKLKYVTHNSDWSEKYYIDVVRNNNTTSVYYEGTKQKTC